MDKQKISGYKIFKGLSDDVISQIADFAEEKNLDSNYRILQEGSKAEKFYLIESGAVNILAEQWSDNTSTKSTELVAVQKLSTGDVLGWSWLTEPFTWGFNAETTEPTKVIAVDGAKLRNLIETDSKVGLELYKRFMGVMKDRLIATRIRLALHSSEPFVSCEGG